MNFDSNLFYFNSMKSELHYKMPSNQFSKKSLVLLQLDDNAIECVREKPFWRINLFLAALMPLKISAKRLN